MTDLVYVLGKGSLWNNNELRYSLRSVEKHLSGVGRVFIVGECPPFLTNVTHIKASDDKKAIPDTNIMHKIWMACSNPEISETFLFLNDDHYLLQDFEADKFPYYYHKTIVEYVKKRGHDGYGKRCENTQKSLENRNKSTKYFDLHYPILYSKTAFIKHVVNAYDHSKKDGMILKSLYANGLQIEGTEIQDCKIPHLLLKDLPCYSTYPTVSAGAQKFLKEMFPNKSRFEL